MRTIDLVLDERVISNPGQGVQSVQRPGVPTDGLKSTSAYIKFYASELVRADGSYNMQPVISKLEACKAAGVRMVTRLAIIDPAETPYGFDMPSAWVSKMRTIAFTSADTKPPHSRQFRTPDLTDPAAVTELQKFFRDFASACKPYGATLEGIDPYFWGLWGEGHYSATKVTANGPIGSPVPLPPLTTRKIFLDLIFELFPNQFKLACLDDNEACAYVISKGGGWRQDGAGNTPHMRDLIPKWIAAAAAQLTYLNTPIAFEIYSNLQWWISQGYNLDDKFNELLRYGVSLVNLKSVSPPDITLDAVQRFLSRVGFQPFIAQVYLPDEIRAGQVFDVGVLVKNLGAAPSYKPLMLSVNGALAHLTKIFPGGDCVALYRLNPQAEGPLQLTAEMWHGADRWQPKNASFAAGITHLGTAQVLPPATPAPEDPKVLWAKLRSALEG